MSDPTEKSRKNEPLTVYPLSVVLLYDGMTVLHFVLGGLGIYLSYHDKWYGAPLALLYLALAFGQMLVWMPLRVCPNCPYYHLAGARCISALNLLSRRIAPRGKPQRFARRAKGWLCHNNFYLASLVAPIVLMIPGLLLNFSALLLVVLLVVIGLTLLRFFVVFRWVACNNCHARLRCSNAAMMGLDRS